MTAPVRLLFFAGSARAGSYNKKVARLGAMIAEANGIPSTFLDLGDYPMPLYNADLEAAEGQPENAKKLTAVMQAHSGICIVSPEYNASITPLLKNTLDWVSHVGEPRGQVYKTRVFALASASNGGMGGLRSLTTVRQVLELGLGALVLPDQFAVPRAKDAFGEGGHLTNKESQENFKALIQKLARAAHVLHG
jgi:chromate reductase, NAD(P)H dehydrogenase (quinone)